MTPAFKNVGTASLPGVTPKFPDALQWAPASWLSLQIIIFALPCVELVLPVRPFFVLASYGSGFSQSRGEIPITGPGNHPAFCNKACKFNAIDKIMVEKGVSVYALASRAREFLCRRAYYSRCLCFPGYQTLHARPPLEKYCGAHARPCIKSEMGSARVWPLRTNGTGKSPGHQQRSPARAA